MKIVKKNIVFLFNFRLKVILNKKINKIFRGIVQEEVDIEILQKHQSLWNQLGTKPNVKWIKSYIAINKKQDYRYITEYDYYTKIELSLNNRTLSEAYSDKNRYHKFMASQLLPSVYVRNIEGVYYTEDYTLLPTNFLVEDCIQSEVVIVKHALETGGGKGILKFTKKENQWLDTNGNSLSLEFLNTNYSKNFLIQECVFQHNFYAQFNASSLNTVRIFTYRSVLTNEIISLQAVLRIGAKGSIVDNQASGGIAVGIDEQGNLHSFGVNKNAKKIDNFNDVRFADIGQVYKFEEMKTLCKRIAMDFPYHRLLGFDCCVDSKGEIKLIEVNTKNNEINFFQFNNGSLFKDYTDEIIDFCKTSKQTYVFDFEN